MFGEAMQDWSTVRRWRHGVRLAAATGALVGAVEAVWWVARAPIAWTVVDALLLGGTAVAGMAAWGGLLGALVGPIHTLRSSAPAHRNIAAQVGLTAGCLLGVYLWPWAQVLHGQGRAAVAALVVLMPIGSAGVVHLNARFWLARQAMGQAPWLGFTAVAWGLAAVLVGLTAMAAPLRDHGGAFALADDPSMLVITVEGLSAGDVAMDAGLGTTPHLAALAQEGTLFRQAVVPSTSSVANHGALWTGLHPLRHRAFDDMRALSEGWPTVPERLAQEGFATAAFLSSAVVSEVGLSQGFAIYDDEPSPGHIARLRWVDALRGERWLRRDTADTVAAFTTWLRGHGQTPHLAWVHLAEPDVGRMDEALGTLLASVRTHGRDDGTLIAVLGVHGVDPGQDGAGLSDRLVHVPLVMRTPAHPMGAQVDHQVRLVDVPLTLLAYAALDRTDEAEGLDLLGFGDGRRTIGLWTSLVGHNEAGDAILGLRHQGVKYVLDPTVDEEDLFVLASDPAESRDLLLEQPETADKARSLLQADLASLPRLLATPDLGPRRRARLDALEVP